MNYLCPNEACPGVFARLEAGGNPKADDGAAALRDRFTDEPIEPVCFSSTRHGYDIGEARGDPGLRPKTRCGDDKRGILPLRPHIPTSTDLVFAAFKLR